MSANAVIVGGGLAGSAAAIELARAGREVVLLEREAQPQHKVCGEFLSQEALAYLRALGVDPAELGAETLHSVRLAGAQHVSCALLPFAAMSMTRKRLDEALLQRAVEAGVRVMRGAAVRSLERNGSLWRAKTDDIAVAAPTAFLASGKHDLPGHPRPAGAQLGLVGFKMYFRLAPQQAAKLQGHIELMLFRGGYGGLSLVEGGDANLCWLVEARELKQQGGRYENLLAAMQRDCLHLAERLEGAEPLLARPLAIASIPYGYVRKDAEEGLWALGDQATVIPSFTGDGMSIALHSGLLAARIYLAGEAAASYQQRLHGELEKHVSLATLISRGLLSRPSRAMLASAVRAWPQLLRVVAQHTRIPKRVRLA